MTGGSGILRPGAGGRSLDRLLLHVGSAVTPEQIGDNYESARSGYALGCRRVMKAFLQGRPGRAAGRACMTVSMRCRCASSPARHEVDPFMSTARPWGHRCDYEGQPVRGRPLMEFSPLPGRLWHGFWWRAVSPPFCVHPLGNDCKLAGRSCPGSILAPQL